MKLKFDKVVLFGGGELTEQLLFWLKKNKINFFFTTSPRHLNEMLKKGNFSNFYKENKKNFLIIKKFDEIVVKKVLKINDINTSLFLSIAAPWIFKEKIINFFNGKLFNLHGTRLPQLRGGAPFSWMILMGMKLGFCQLHKVEKKIDSGDIVKFEEFLYPSSCKIPIDYIEYYNTQNLVFLKKIIEKRKSGILLKNIKQSEYLSSYWPRLNSEINGFIDWSMSPIELERFICAFDDPYKGASTFLNNKKVFIKKAQLDFSDANFHSYQTGIIFRKNHKWACVALNKATLIIEKLCDVNNNNLLKKLKIGDRFFTEPSYLKKNKKRVKITP